MLEAPQFLNIMTSLWNTQLVNDVATHQKWELVKDYGEVQRKVVKVLTKVLYFKLQIIDDVTVNNPIEGTGTFHGEHRSSQQQCEGANIYASSSNYIVGYIYLISFKIYIK